MLQWAAGYPASRSQCFMQFLAFSDLCLNPSFKPVARSWPMRPQVSRTCSMRHHVWARDSFAVELVRSACGSILMEIKKENALPLKFTWVLHFNRKKGFLEVLPFYSFTCVSHLLQRSSDELSSVSHLSACAHHAAQLVGGCLRTLRHQSLNPTTLSTRVGG